MVVASRPSHPNRTYHRRTSGSYSTCCVYSAAATGPSRWWAMSSYASSSVMVLDRRRRRGTLRALDRGACGEIAVQPPQPRRRDAPEVTARSGQRARAHGPGKLEIREDDVDRRRVVDGGPALDEEPGVAGVDDRSEATGVGGDEWRTAGGGLRRDEPERLRPRGDEADVGRRVVGDEPVVGLGRDEAHPVVEVEIGDERAQHAHLRLSVVPARTTHHEEGHVTVELGERAHRQIGALEALDAPDVQEHTMLRLEAERESRRLTVARPEHALVDSQG